MNSRGYDDDDDDDDGHEVFERDLVTDHARKAVGYFWDFCLQFLILSMKFNVQSEPASSQPASSSIGSMCCFDDTSFLECRMARYKMNEIPMCKRRYLS